MDKPRGERSAIAWAGLAGGPCLAALAYGQGWIWKLLGIALMVAPHVVGAPHPEVHESLAPAALTREFIVASLVASALVWLTLGLGVGLLLHKFGLDRQVTPQEAGAT